jgi:D-arabinose 1-dehydrogenase-like Zn-dependent alcohol dehydrogenase
VLHGDVDYGAIDDELERRQHRLQEVVGMASLGRLKILVDRYPLSAAKQAYDDFEHGRLVSRAVLMPALHAGDDGATAS